MGDRKRVILFQDGSKGIGHSKLQEGTIHSSISWDCRTEGQAAPSLKHSTTPTPTFVGPTDIYNGQSISWLDATDYLLLHTQGPIVNKVQADAVATDLTGALTFTGSAMHDDGSGVAYWYLCAGTGEHIRRRTSAGVWTQDDDVHADLLCSINGVLYKTLGANIYTCPAASDPFTAASWSAAAIQVGTPQWNCTGIASAGNAPIVGKPDGLYRYNAADSKYEDVLLGSLKSCAHPDNGKGMSTWREFALYPLHDGRLLAFDGYRVYDWSPIKNATPDRDTPYGFRLTCFASAGPHGFYAAQDIGNVRTQRPISWVYWYDATGEGTYNNITTNVTDSKPSTTGTVGAVDTNDFLYLGATTKFQGVYFSQTGTGTVTITDARYWNGAAWVSVTPVGLETLTIDGLVFSALSFSDWATTTVNSKAGLYWWRFYLTGGGTTTIKELYIIPHRPPVGIAAGNDYTGIDRVNLLSHILYCRPRGDDADWSDLSGILLGVPANRLEVSQAAVTADNAGDKLAVLSAETYRYILLGSRATPQLTPFVQCQRSSTGIGVPYLELGGTDFGWPEKSKALRKLFLHFDNLDDSDKVEVFCRWDQNTAWWKASQSNTGPFTVEFPNYDAQQGVVCHVGIALNDAAVESACPVLRLVEAEVEDMGDFGAIAQPLIATPEVM